MGFSVAGATGIILAGFLFYMGTLTSAVFNAQQSVQDAGHLAERRTSMDRFGTFTIDDVLWDDPSDQANITATNTGGVTFHFTGFDVLLQGAVSTENITSYTVNGEATGVWAPATQILLIVSTPTDPTDVVLVAPSGASAYWRAP